MVWAQTAPARFDISPSSVEQGECYTISVGTPNITLDVKYRFNNGSAIILYGWPSIGSNGTARICTSSSTDPGVYTFVEARNTLGGAWVSGGDRLTVTAPPPPDFTLTASPSSRSVGPTGSATYTVSVSPRNGFNSTVNLSASGLGSNVTASFSRSALSSPYTTTSTLTLTANGASAGTRSVTLTGTGGGLTRTDSVELRVVVPQPTTYRMSPDAGYAGAHTVRATVGNGAGMSLNLRYTINGGTTQEGTIQLDANGQWSYNSTRNDVVGTYVYTEMKNALASGWVSISETYIVRPPQPTTMSISPSSLTLPGSYTMTVGNGAGMTLDVRYTLTPPGGTTGPVQTLYDWPVQTAGGGDNGTVDITAGVGTPPGVYRYTAMRNTLNTAWVNVNAAVTVRRPPPPDFTLTATPGSRTVESGGSATEATYTVAVSPANGFNSAVDLSASGLPAEGTAAFDPEVLSSPYTGSSTLTLRVPALSPAGTTEVTVTGTGGGLSRTASVDLVVVPQPTTYQMSPDAGYAGGHTVRATVGNGAGMSLNLRYTINGGTTQEGTIQLDANGQWSYNSTRNDVVGTYVYTEMKNALASGWVSISETYIVRPPQPTTMSISPSELTPPGSYTMTVGNGAGMTLDVRYTLTPPGGTTGPVQTLYDWPVQTAGGGDNGTVDITAGVGTPPGVYRYTAMRNTLNTAWVNVNAAVTIRSLLPPDFTLTATPESRTVESGGSATEAAYTVTVVPELGFAQAVTLSASGLPADVTAAFDPEVLSSPYTDSTLTLRVAALATAGTTEVTLTGAGGSLSRTDSVELIVVSQPTTYQMSPDAGYAGAHTVRATVGNGAGMSLDLRYTINGGTTQEGTIQLDANGQWSYVSTRADVIGTYVYTEMKNALASGWVTIDETYIVRPPQPTTMSVSDSSIDPPESYTMTVGNGTGMTLDVQYTLTRPGETDAGPVQIMKNWPVLTAAGGGSTDGTAEITVNACMLPGVYRYTAMRNTLNAPADDEAEANWIPVTVPVTVNGPVSVTSVTPSRIVAGTRAEVTLSGQYLCDLRLSTDYSGITISNVTFDSAEDTASDAGRTATATITVADSATVGTATVEVRGGEGTAAFNLGIGPAPSFTITAKPAVGYVAPTGSAPYTVTVVPVSGFDQDVALSVSGLGSNVTAEFSPSSLSAPYTSTSALTLRTNGASVGTRTVTLTGTGGGLSPTASVELVVVAQPTSFQLSAASGYAGTHTMTATVGNGARMEVDLRLTVNGGPERIIRVQLNASGQWHYRLPRSQILGPYGPYVFTGMRNALLSESDLASDWVPLNVTYTVRPPQPTTMSISPSELTPPGSYTMRVGNGSRLTLDVQYTLTPPGGTTGPVQTLYGWPVLTSAGGDNGTVDIAADVDTPPGVYRYTAMRNTLNTAWVTLDPPVEVTIRSLLPPDFTLTATPESRTVESGGSATEAAYTVTVVPELGFAQAVTLSASGLPANVTATFDPDVLSSPYTDSTLTLRVPALATAGTTEVTLTGAGGSLSRTDSVELVVVPQPTTYQMSPDWGYAGAHTVMATVGNGAAMSLNLRYTINGGTTQEGTIQLDANGQWSYSSTRADVIGTYVYTEMKNALASGWVSIDEPYIVRPPQPTTMSMSPPELPLPGDYTMTVGNGAGMTLDVQYTLTPPGETDPGPVETIENWLDLVPVEAGSPDGTAVISASGCKLPGEYLFTQMRNTLNAAWVPVSATVTHHAPVSVTSVMPSSISVGAPAMVTLEGAGLCGLTLSTTYPGVSISEVTFDSVEGDGTSASAMITVDATTALGTVTVAVRAGDGTTTFDLAIVPPPDFTLTASPSSQPVAPTGSADYTVTVVPANGFAQAVELSVDETSLPANVMAGFDPSSLSAPYDAASTLTLTTAGASVGTESVTITGTGGGLSRTTAVGLEVAVPQPTTIEIDPSEGYVGAYTLTVTVGNGANMSLDLRYTWNGGAERTGTIPLDANGQWSLRQSRGVGTGVYVFTGMKNALLSEWVPIHVTHTSKAPQPVTMSLSPPSLSPPRDYTVTVGNGAGMTLDVQYERTLPGETTAGPVQTIENWPVLTTASGRAGRAEIAVSACTPPGAYRYTAMRNAAHTDDVDWVALPLDPPVAVTLNSPVSVTSVSPASISVGDRATVTLRGQYLCDLTLFTTYPGVTISNVVFDSAHNLEASAGMTATAMIEVDATAAVGTATVEVRGGEGTAAFNLGIGATGFTLTASPPVAYAPPTGSAAYTVTVKPVSGFAAAVNLSVSGLPANVTAAFSPSALSAPHDTESTLTLTTAGASVGTRTLILTVTGGAQSRTASVELVVVPQPTTYHITPDEGYAGAHTVTVTVGNGAGMSLDLRYTLNGEARTGTIQLDANGQWSAAITRAMPTGTYVYTEMKNALLESESNWVTIDATNATYTTHPPQPTTMSVNPSSFNPPGDYTMTVGNGAGMTLDVQYTLTPPGGTTGPITPIYNWPVLNAAAAGSSDGTGVISATGCTPPGVYTYTHMRNTLNAPADDEAEANWVGVAVPVTIDSPVSVTAVAPPSSLPPPVGGSAAEVPVTITGKGLCALALTTTYTGLTISNLVFDGAVGEGTSATATFTIAPGTLPGIAEIAVAAGGGSTTFDFVIGTAATELILSAASTAVSEDPDTEPVSGAPANAGQSVAVTVTVAPPPASGTGYTGCNIRAVAADTTAGATDYSLPASGLDIRAVDSWSKTFTFWVLDDTEDDDDETLVLEAFCTGRDTGAPPPVAHDALVSAQLAFLITDNDQAASVFTVTAAPESGTVAPGGMATYTVSVTPLDGFNQAVTLSASGLPANVTAAFAPAVLSAPYTGTSTLTLTAADGATAVIAAAVTVTGTAGSVEATASVNLTVTTDPFFTITAAPESGTVAPGGMATYTVSVTPLNGFNQAVTLSASGLPANVTAAFAPAVLSAPYTGSSTLTLTAADAATAVTAAGVTVTGTAGSLSPTVVVNLTVTTTALQREYIYLGGRVIAVESP